jgi:PAS domain S-box-containing protein
MKLRTILMVLSLLAFVSAATGGYFYYTTLKAAAFKEAQRQAATRVQIIKKNLSSYLSESVRPVAVLAGMPALRQALILPDAQTITKANAILDHFNKALKMDVCYLMDAAGTTIASSNRNAADSFVNKNFSFRPYYKKAIAGSQATYLALGTTSGRRGAYASHPIYAKGQERPIGVVVIKAAIDLIERELGPANNELVLVTDPQGVIFISNQKGWRYNLLWQVSAKQRAAISKSRQFGRGPWAWSGLSQVDQIYATDRSGMRFLMHKAEIDHYPGWHVIHLRSLKEIARVVSGPMIQISGPLVLSLCILIGFAVSLLYRAASHEISQRKKAEEALRQSEERYRVIYHHTPAMLHSIDRKGRLVSVSDHWVEALGYNRKEAIGQKLTKFFSSASKHYAEKTVMPQFFKTGFCKDISYQYVKKNGQFMDVLLSAIVDRDLEGKTIRTLAVSIDVTERNRAEKALKKATEKLSRYSKELERQVRERTREITNILKYTPAVVYIKDRKGRYILVNSRYEELFQISSDDVHGRTDEDILPPEVAQQFRTHDLKAYNAKKSYQVEEHISQPDGVHTYLSIKFPIYDETGLVTGVGGIATDMTDVKKARDQLHRLSGSIMVNQEKERSAIARELHDELGQLLTALRMDSVWLKNRLKAKDATAAKRALTMCSLIDMTIKETRRIAFGLRPGVLDDLGLVDALEWYTADFERHTGIACVFEHLNVPAIDENVATAAYRITQEALTNVARHAGASRAQVNLKFEAENMALSITDDGKGFKQVDLNESDGLGVAGMRERAALAGGSLTVTTRPEGGICVRFSVFAGQNGIATG